MSRDDLTTKLRELLPISDQVEEIMKLVDLQNPYKKYFQTEKGKAAKQRAQQKWLASEKAKAVLARQKDKKAQERQLTTENIQSWMQDWCLEYTNQEPYRQLHPVEYLDPTKFPRYRYEKLTTLWKPCKEGFGSSITRKRFGELVSAIGAPLFVEVSKWDKDGKTYYTPALRIDCLVGMNILDLDGSPVLEEATRDVLQFLKEKPGGSFEDFHNSEMFYPQVTRELFDLLKSKQN